MSYIIWQLIVLLVITYRRPFVIACIVCGLFNESIQKHLLVETKLTSIKMIEIAQGMEAADRNIQRLKGMLNL